MTEKVTIVFGASSQIGYFLIPSLLECGGQVIAVSRQPLPWWFQQYVDEPRLRWCNIEHLLQLSLPGSVDLVCSGPLELAGKLVAELSPGKVIALSSASVLFKQHSSDRGERQLMAGILQAEENLSAWAQQNQSGLHILRPTLVYGCGLDKNLSRAADLIRRFGFMPVVRLAAGLRQPVHAKDLCMLMVKLLAGETTDQHTWALAGGSRLTYAQMMQAVFAALEKPARLLRMPLWALQPVSRIVPGINPQMINRQNQDLCIDDGAARMSLNWQPRPFNLLRGDLFTAQLANP